MKKNFDVVLKNFDGKEIFEQTKEGQTALPVKAKDSIISALMASDQADGNEKFKRYQLAEKVHNDEQEYTTEELSLIKTLVGKFMNQIAIGPIYRIIEQD